MTVKEVEDVSKVGGGDGVCVCVCMCVCVRVCVMQFFGLIFDFVIIAITRASRIESFVSLLLGSPPRALALLTLNIFSFSIPLSS